MENRSQPGEVYTLGFWRARAGKEQEFIEHWTSLAQWTSSNFSGAGKAHLLQDEKNSSVLISFDPWRDHATIQTWRETTEFKNFIRVAKELCEEVQPNTLRVVSSS